MASLKSALLLATLLCASPALAQRADLPDRAGLEAALVDVFQCRYGPAEDCFIYVETVTLERARCTPIGHDPERRPRVACRVSGVIGYTSRRRPEAFADLCLRLARYSFQGQTPQLWGLSVEGDTPRACDGRRRGTDILR